MYATHGKSDHSNEAASRMKTFASLVDEDGGKPPNEAKPPAPVSHVLIPSFAQRLPFASSALNEGDFIEKAVICITNHCFFMVRVQITNFIYETIYRPPTSIFKAILNFSHIRLPHNHGLGKHFPRDSHIRESKALLPRAGQARVQIVSYGGIKNRKTCKKGKNLSESTL